MNNIKLVVYVTMLAASCNACGMHGLFHCTISKEEAQNTVLALKWSKEENQAQIFEHINNSRKNLSKSDPSALLLLEKARKNRAECYRRHALAKRHSV